MVGGSFWAELRQAKPGAKWGRRSTGQPPHTHRKGYSVQKVNNRPPASPGPPHCHSASVSHAREVQGNNSTQPTVHVYQANGNKTRGRREGQVTQTAAFDI
uniref:Uncharacterized protein n=1 Tax=Eutreptiella gymnastica TaxID=73025 RepID=A0A6T2GFA2_9EUGL|mmetsp:Transcript_38728/g.64347  ORF Transcript_38728/g.64347 Transcript_38728/m.64347 type:complete len:101 (-) Transcript_38728:38-340(-)